MDINQFCTPLDYLKRCELSEKQVEILSKKVDDLINGTLDDKTASADKELDALLTANRKLKYRICILKKSINCLENNRTSSSNMVTTTYDKHMFRIIGQLESCFTEAIAAVYPEIKEPAIQIQLSKVADYQCNAALSLAKTLKKNPREIAQGIISVVNSKACPAVSKLELSGPGFINITLCQEFVRKQVNNIVINGIVPPFTKSRRVVIDFSSPNIAKEMHVGHLRSTIIGESISRLLEFLGHDVLRLNHLGDWGTQFGMLIAHLRESYPDYLTNPPPISNLQLFYKESKKRFDEDAPFKEKAYKSVVKLQSHEPEYIKGWQMICDISLHEFQKVYDQLGVSIISRGESFYQDRMLQLIQELEAKGLLLEEDGRKVMFGPEADIPLTIVKSDGGFTYDTSDLACLKQRIEEEKGQWLIYVTDAGQAQHFKTLFACAKKAGFWNPAAVCINHVTFGVVLGEDKKKFKTRSGDTVRLVDLLNEGLDRAEEKLIEGGRDKVISADEFQKAKKSVAYGCIKYADLCHDRTRDYVFSFDRMIDFSGNTAAYLLYALTRIRSILRTAGITRNHILSEAQKNPVKLEHEKEWLLARSLLKMPDVLNQIAEDLYIHPLCEYLYEVSTVFSEFYSKCYCVEKNEEGQIVGINMNRMILCEATAVVMEQCFHILGIETLDKM